MGRAFSGLSDHNRVSVKELSPLSSAKKRVNRQLKIAELENEGEREGRHCVSSFNRLWYGFYWINCNSTRRFGDGVRRQIPIDSPVRADQRSTGKIEGENHKSETVV